MDRFKFEPLPIGAEAAAMSRHLQKKVERLIREKNSAIEAACFVAIARGCGVRVDEYEGGGWAVRVDDTNPNLEQRYYRHGHTQYPYGSHPGCVNCESRDAGRG